MCDVFLVPSTVPTHSLPVPVWEPCWLRPGLTALVLWTHGLPHGHPETLRLGAGLLPELLPTNPKVPVA